MRPRIGSALFLATFFFGIVAAGLELRERFFLPALELRLWGVQGPALADPLGFASYLSNAPLAFHNLLGPLMKLFGVESFFLPYVLILGTFTFLLAINLFRVEAMGQLGLRLLLITLCLSHPEALEVLTSNPLALLLLIFLWLFTKGLLEANAGNLGRGVLLMGFSSALLVLSGALGIAYALALFALVPILIRGDLFRESVSGGFLVLTFPAAAALSGLFYLGWLYHLAPGDLAFMSPVTLSLNFEILPWLPFLPLIPVLAMPWGRSVMARIFSLKTPVLGILAYVFASALGKEFSLEAILGMTAIGAGLEFLNRQQLSLFHLLAAVSFSAAAWLSPVTVHQSPAIRGSSWHALQAWVRAGVEGQVMILSPRHTLMTLGAPNRHEILRPGGVNFRQRLILGNFQGIGRLVVEIPKGRAAVDTLARYQERYFFSPPKGLQLVFDDETFRVYDRNPKMAAPRITEGPLSKGLPDPWRLIRDVFTGVLFLGGLLVVGRRSINSERNS